MKNISKKQVVKIVGIIIVILIIPVSFFLNNHFNLENSNQNKTSSSKKDNNKTDDIINNKEDNSKNDTSEEVSSEFNQEENVNQKEEAAEEEKKKEESKKEPNNKKEDSKKDTQANKNTEEKIESKQEVSNSQKEETTDKKNETATPTKTPAPAPTTSPSPSPSPTPVVETQEMKNEKLRSAIKSKYGITVKYGDEIGSYRPRNATPNLITDAARNGEFLSKIDTILATYPNGFFQDFINKGMPLTIFLVESMQGNAFEGFLDSEFYSDLKLTITASTYWFERTLNHELMHYIDAYLSIVMYPIDLEEEWMKLNPAGYVYGYANSSYNFNFSNPTQGYFTRDYGQTNYKEDRATIFEDLMTRAYKNAMYNDGVPIKEKAKAISNQIRQYFPSVSGQSPYWDRMLK